MTFDEYISLIDFLNNRLRKFKSPWYTWAIEITWEKLERWGANLGWTSPNQSLKPTSKLAAYRRR